MISYLLDFALYHRLHVIKNMLEIFVLEYINAFEFRTHLLSFYLLYFQSNTQFNLHKKIKLGVCLYVYRQIANKLYAFLTF